MRLTIHHSADILPYWLDSLNKLLAPDNLDREKLLHAGQWHIATFNDRIVGLAITSDEEILYLAVRDVTRRRGVGQYLVEEVLRDNPEISSWRIADADVEDRGVMAAFMQALGFNAQTGGWVKKQ